MVVVQRCSVREVFLEISQNSQENTCARVSFLINLQVEACNVIKKETLAQLFSCKFCEISKNTISYRIPLVAAYGNKRFVRQKPRALRKFLLESIFLIRFGSFGYDFYQSTRDKMKNIFLVSPFLSC